MSQPAVGLVVGYLYNIDRASRQAMHLQLPSRFSIILNAYAWDEEGRTFDLDLFCDLLSAVLYWVGSDSLAIATEQSQVLTFPSVGDLKAYYQKLPLEDREPFASLRAVRQGRVTCLVETEFYNRVGGPMPYHDQYVFAFYVSDYQPRELQRMILRRCVELDVSISEIRQGSGHPQFSLATRLRQLLGWP